MQYRPKWVDQALKDGKYPFFVQMPTKVTKDANGRLTVQVLGSKVERSRTGHKMMQSAIDMMKQDSIGKISLMNHDPHWIAGKVTGIAESAADEIHPTILIKKPTGNPVIDAPIAQVESCLDEDIPMGASFGGIADNVKFTKDGLGVDVYTVETMEWSLTPINAVGASDGTMHAVDQVCKDGVCGQIAQQILHGPYLPELTEGGDMLKQNTNKKVQQSSGCVLNQPAYEFAMQCLEDGNVDFETPWNRGMWDSDYSDMGDPEEIANSCLGVDETSSDYWDRYQYRICKDGVLYKNAVISVADNAPAGSTIYEAADEILEKIYQMTDDDSSDGGVVEECVKCPICGEKQEYNFGYCEECGSQLPQNQSINQTGSKGGDNMVKGDKSPLEQKVDTIMEYINRQKEKEAKDALEAQTQSRIDQALAEQKEEHDEEMKTLKETYENAAKEVVQEEFKKILGNKNGVRQASRYPEDQKNGSHGGVNQGVSFQMPTRVAEEGKPVINRNSDKTVTQQVAEQMTLDQRIKSSVFHPAVVKGQVMETAGYTPEEFLTLKAKGLI